MAIKSAINPAVATPTRSASYKSFQNFITGGSDLGTSVVSSAANKIVNFQRGAAGVAPRVPDLGSIIQTLSTNILNNVEGRVDSINQNVNNVVNKFIQKLEGNYQSKMQSIDANGPSKILENFLSLYDKAIGYIQFFANPRNVRNLGDNLKELRNVFAETFEVAKNIRKTIVRIVGQLSNLPTASAGGGGINLDVDLPGAPLKKSGAPLRRGIRGKGALLGAAGLGFGAGAITSALAQPGSSGQVQPVSTETGGGLSQPLLEKFSSILDRFEAAIKSLSTKKQESQQTKTKTPTSPGPKETSTKIPTTPTGPSDFTGSTNAEKAFNFFKSQGYTDEQSAGIVGNLIQESGVDPTKKNAKGYTGIAQWDPKIRYPRLVQWAKTQGLDPNALETQLQFIADNLRTGEEGLSASTLKSAKTEQEAAHLFVKQYERSGEGPGDVGYENRIKYARDVLKRYKGKPSTAVAKQQKDQKVLQPGVTQTGQVAGQTTVINSQVNQELQSKVAAAPSQQQMQQQVAQQVSKPIVAQAQQQVNVVPLNMGQQGARAMSKPPTTSAGKISGESSIPFLPSSNPDNFLTLYSKMVYNIVDG